MEHNERSAMDGQAPGTRRISRSRGESSRRFTEVVSLGPTSIPDNEQVAAAFSGAHAFEEAVSGRLNREGGGGGERQGQGHERIDQVFSSPAGNRTSCANSLREAPRSAAGASVARDGNLSNGRVDSVPLGDAEGGAAGASSGLLSWALAPIWSVLGAVRWAGASVNDVAVAPFIRLTSPWGLAGSLLTALKAYTPQRARDLSRVMGNVVLNFAGLVRTRAGSKLIRSTGRAAGSLSTAVSSPAGRQLVVDFATGYVKLAEALDTPEFKAAIQQGAVVVARGVDLLADRRSKMFFQDVANLLGSLVELANSNEVTVMAAELTANVVHALEIEQIARTDSSREDEGDIVRDDVDARDVGVRASAGGSAMTRDPVDASGSAGQDAPPSTVTNSRSAVDGNADPEEVKVHERNSNNLQPDSDLRTASSSVDERVTDERTADTRMSPDEFPMVLDGNPDTTQPERKREGDMMEVTGSNSSQNDRSPTVAAGSRGARIASDSGVYPCTSVARRVSDNGHDGLCALRPDGVRVILAPITQADLDNNSKMRITRAPSRCGVIASATRGATKAGSAEPCQNGPSNPTGQLDSSRVGDTTAPVTFSDLGTDAGACRARAHSTTGVEHAAGNTTAVMEGTRSGDDSYGREDGERRLVEFSGTITKNSGTRGGDGPNHAPEYARDGRHLLPRFTSENFTSLFRRPPDRLDRMLGPPSFTFLEQALSLAAVRSREGELLPGDRSQACAATAEPPDVPGTVYAAGDAAASQPSVLPTPRGESGRGESNGNVWFQIIFALTLITLAVDGLLQRASGLFARHNGRQSLSSSRGVASFPRPYSDVVDSSGHDGAEGGFERQVHAAFLPPRCREQGSESTMTILIAPSGPCLAPESNQKDIWATLGSLPTCAASFRMCTAEEAGQGLPADREWGSRSSSKHRTSVSDELLRPRDEVNARIRETSRSFDAGKEL